MGAVRDTLFFALFVFQRTLLDILSLSEKPVRWNAVFTKFRYRKTTSMTQYEALDFQPVLCVFRRSKDPLYRRFGTSVIRL